MHVVRRSAGVVLALLACAAPALASPTVDRPVAAAAQAPTILPGRTTTIHGRDGFARTFHDPVKLTDKEIRFGSDEDEDADVPRIRQVPAPDGPPVPPTPDDGPATARASRADDYTLFRSTAVTPGAGTATRTGEPTVANARGSLLFTGNKYAAVSADNGLTWSALHPGDASAYPQYDGGFCCDQIAYAVDRGRRSLVFWVRQFRKDKAKKPKDGANGRVSLIVFQGGKELTEDEVTSQQDYCEYAFRPSDFGQIRASWFDFNQMSNTKKFLYMSSKAEKTSGGFLGGIVWRIAIADLDHDDCPDIEATYWTGNGSNPSLVQGAGNRRAMHWASAGAATNTISIARATDSSTTAFVSSRTITSYLNTERPTTTSSARAATCALADGTDPCLRVNDRINTGYRAAGEVGWFWAVRQGPGRPWPHVRGVRFTSGPDPQLIDEPDIWNRNFAWIYPSVGVDAAGHEAVIAYQVGGSFFPKPAAALVDDVAPDTDWVSLLFHGLATSSAGANTWGDYEAVRAYDECPNTYAGAVQRMTGATPQHRFVWFGRERDACPDLVTTSVRVGRTSVAPGHLVRVHHTIENTGSGQAPASTTQFFWSADAVRSSGDERSPDTTSAGAVAPAAVTKMPVVGLPAPTRPGTYYLLACADGAHAFSEVSDKNNCRAATDPVVVADRAQARVSAVDVLQAHVAAGASLRLRVRVRQPAHPGARTVGIYLARRPSAGGRPIRVGTLTAPPAAGVVRASGSVTLPRRAPASPLRFLLACVGRPSAGRCLVAPRPVFVIHRAR